MNKNGFVNIIIIGVVVVIIATAGYLAMTRKTEAPATVQEVETSVEIKTEEKQTTGKNEKISDENLATKDWGIYKSEKYRFYFNYPKDKELKNITPIPADISLWGGNVKETKERIGILNKNDVDVNADISVITTGGKTELEIIRELKNFENKNVNDINWYIRHESVSYIDEDGKFILAETLKEGMIYRIKGGYYIKGHEDPNRNSVKLFNQILSTFKFTR